MTVIVDASVVVAALIDAGRHGAWSEAIIRDNRLMGPELLLIEVSNVLRRLEAGGLISRPEASLAQGDLFHLSVELVPVSPLLDRVWALRHNHTSYDATYIAAAEAFELPLATLDIKMSQPPSGCEFLLPPA